MSFVLEKTEDWAIEFSLLDQGLAGFWFGFFDTYVCLFFDN